MTPLPQMREVHSSHVAKVGYDAETAELFVTWDSGKTSVYVGVPPTLAAEVKHFATITYQNLPATGLLLDATAFAGLTFPEGETLHFKPAGSAAGIMT